MLIETMFYYPTGYLRLMTFKANTLGRFIADLMNKTGYTNRSLATAAGVSESAVRNLLKYGVELDAKDPDARTLSRIADALNVDALRLFRLAGYIPPLPAAHSPRGDYLADVFDHLPPEKQEAVLGVIEAMAPSPQQRTAVRAMRDDANNPLAGLDLSFPGILRLMANQLILHYDMSEPVDVSRIESDAEVLQNKWDNLPSSTQERVKALIRQKLSLDYDPTMVDEQWRR